MTTRIINVKLFVHRNYIFAFEGGPEKEGYLSSFGKGRTIGGTFVGSILVEETTTGQISPTWSISEAMTKWKLC